jgi:hypothetical protein
MSLPTTGQQNWGVPLNQYITTAVLAVANQALTSVNTHTSASDPHGDRAYAAGLVGPITSGINLANGYVKLDGFGKISPTLMPAGSSLTNYFDAKANFGATGNGSTDDSSFLQAALDACTAAGGGEVWVADGVYACGTQLVIGAGTWLHLSPGATIKRIIPSGGSAPAVMLSNVSFTAGPPATPAAGNLLISGGKWDAVGSGLVSSCTPILLVQASFATIIQAFFNGVAANPLVELNGCKYVTLRDDVFTGTTLTGTSVVPAVRLNSTSSSTTPTGMASGVYNNSVCSQIMVEACALVATGAHPPVGKLVGSDLFQASFTHSNVAVTGCFTPGGTFSSEPQVDFVHATSSGSFGNQLNTSSGEILDLTTTGNVFVGPSSSGGSPPNVYVAGQVGYATGFSGSFTPEVPHNLTTMSNSWAIGAGGHAQYMLNANGELVLSFKILTPGAVSDGTVIFPSGSLPANYRPVGLRRVAAYTDVLKISAGNYEGCAIELETDGSIQVYGLNAAASRLECYVAIPIAF